MTTLPFLSLPFVPQSIIIKFLDHFDVSKLSLTSKKARNCMRSFNLKVEDNRVYWDTKRYGIWIASFNVVKFEVRPYSLFHSREFAASQSHLSIGGVELIVENHNGKIMLLFAKEDLLKGCIAMEANMLLRHWMKGELKQLKDMKLLLSKNAEPLNKHVTLEGIKWRNRPKWNQVIINGKDNKKAYVQCTSNNYLSFCVPYDYEK